MKIAVIGSGISGLSAAWPWRGLTALTILNAGVPCLFKLISAGLLMRWRGSLEVQYVF